MDKEVRVDLLTGQIFLKSKGEIGFNRQKTLNINMSDVVLMSLTTKFEFDDEQIYATVIDKNLEIHHINFMYFNEPMLDLFEKKFNFKYDTSSISDIDYKEGRSKIVYPFSLKGQNLYKPNNKNFSTYWDLLLRNLRVRQPAGGVLTEDVKLFLQSFR